MAGKTKSTGNIASATEPDDNAVLVTAEEPVAEPVPEPDPVPVPEKDTEVRRLIYIGPSLPRGALNKSAIFVGTMDAILDTLAEIVGKYPQVRKLLVPVSKLAESNEKLKTGGNILSKAYAELVTATSSKEV